MSGLYEILRGLRPLRMTAKDVGSMLYRMLNPIRSTLSVER